MLFRSMLENSPITIDQKISDSQMAQLFALAHQEGALFVPASSDSELGPTHEGARVSLTSSIRIVFDTWIKQLVAKDVLDPDALLQAKAEQFAGLLVAVPGSDVNEGSDMDATHYQALLDFFTAEYARVSGGDGRDEGGGLKIAS